MEQGLVGLDFGLEGLVPSENLSAEVKEQFDLPVLDLFGNEYDLGVTYRPEVDFHVENMESVLSEKLSEKFVDMDEDWFTPTVARHRIEDEARITGKSSTPTVIPTASPIPPRQQAAIPGSFGSALIAGSVSRPGGSRLPSGPTPSFSAPRARVDSNSLGANRWGALAEGLPFAGGSTRTVGDEVSKVRCQNHSGPGMLTVAGRILHRLIRVTL